MPATIFLRRPLIVAVTLVALCLACVSIGGTAGEVTQATPQATTRPAESNTTHYGTARLMGTLANKAANESSGLAASTQAKGVFWTHNDSGDKPQVYAFNSKGEDLGTYTIKGARAFDWEDMASFSLDGKSYLLLADTGDNGQVRKSVTLYIAPEPKLDPDRRGVIGETAVTTVIHFTYSDGPQDVEAVGVDTTTRGIYLVSKRGSRNVYELPLPDSPPKEPLVAKKIAVLGLQMVTAMDISPDGRRAVVLTYGPAFEYTRAANETWAQAFARAGRRIAIPIRKQGESICYGLDGKTLYLTSEKLPTPLLEVPVEGQ
ncbi:MAG TPA: hypothetical protein VM098_09660 [Phycisphaerae bacterium]|nr:hypothetical protein [Phycisphaerae bacterium]